MAETASLATSATELIDTINKSLPTGLKLPAELTQIAKELPSAQEATTAVASHFTGLAINIGIAIAILAAGWIFSKWLASFATRALIRTHMEETAAAFLGSMARYVIVFISIMVALSLLGVTSTGMLAVLGAAGLAIGLALKDFLTHIAAGVMLMVTQPFRVGQAIQVGEFSGTVKRITLFNTEVNTLSNQRIFMPNGTVWNNTIINHNYNQTRQVEVMIRASFEDDIPSVMKVLKDTMRHHPLVRNEPEPFVGADAFLENGVQYIVRCWVKTSDWGNVRYAILGDIKAALEAHGMSVPYPRQVQLPAAYATPHTSAAIQKNRKKLATSLKEEQDAIQKAQQKEVAKAEQRALNAANQPAAKRAALRVKVKADNQARADKTKSDKAQQSKDKATK